MHTLLISSDIGVQVNLTNGGENYMGYQFTEGDELVAKFQQQVNQFPIDQKVGMKVTKIGRIDGGF
jgi:alkyl hydroperoxide reductase subunit F